MFCLKSYYSLFTNLSVDGNRAIDGTYSKQDANSTGRNSHIQNSEMAYFMLDLLFLLGDPKQSTTLLDDSKNNGLYKVNEPIPDFMKQSKSSSDANPERLVRIDRTSQLLLCMSIAIADFVKQYHLRNSS